MSGERLYSHCASFWACYLTQLNTLQYSKGLSTPGNNKLFIIIFVYKRLTYATKQSLVTLLPGLVWTGLKKVKWIKLVVFCQFLSAC